MQELLQGFASTRLDRLKLGTLVIFFNVNIWKEKLLKDYVKKIVCHYGIQDFPKALFFPPTYKLFKDSSFAEYFSAVPPEEMELFETLSGAFDTKDPTLKR